MALPYVVPEQVFTAAIASETKQLRAEFTHTITKIIEVITDGFSGTIDLQGRQAGDGTFDNLAYYQLGQLGVQPFTNAQLPYTLSTSRARYCIPEYSYQTRIVMTRTAGSVTINTIGIALPQALPQSSPLTDAELRATAVPVSGPLTDTELRATAVPISGTVTATLADGQPVALGSTTDAPVVVAEDATARTGISLLKGIKNTLYTSILGVLGATTGVAVVTDADGTVQQYLRGLIKLLVDKITVLPGAQEVHLGKVSGYGALVGVDFTRPADVTAYAAKDVVGPAVTANLTFADLVRVNGGSGITVKARLSTNQAANVATYRLHLFHTAPTPIADNAPFTLLDADKAKRIGFIDVGPAATEGAGSDCAEAENDWVRKAFKCAAASRSITCIATTLTAFTPANAQTFHVELQTVGVD